jgi:hypothetical protein
MPSNKDLKRLVRARMRKTGESYTAARAVVVARERPGSREPKSAAPRRDWPALAGTSDAAVRAKTGRTWAGWVEALDAAGAHAWSHRDIARHLGAEHGVGPWWCQAVTVGYERIRGLRDVGQRPGGAYEANKSRTFAVGVSTLYGMFRDARRRKRWLPEGLKRVRTATADRSMRLDWDDGTQVNLFFTAKGAAKSAVAVQHAKLSAKADVERRKAFWSERLDALRDALG